MKMYAHSMVVGGVFVLLIEPQSFFVSIGMIASRLPANALGSTVTIVRNAAM
jgi:hypothetical protein